MHVTDKHVTAIVDAELNELLPNTNDMKCAMFHAISQACHDHGMRIW